MQAIRLGASGHVLGGDIPLACVPIVAGDVADLLQQARALRSQVPTPDVVEWRADHMQDSRGMNVTDLLAQMHAILDPQIPLMFTNRSHDEGGAGHWREDERLESIGVAASSGFVALVDVELAAPVATRQSIHAAARRAGVGVVVSAHDFVGTPDDTDLVATLAALMHGEADVAKIAVTARSPADALRLLNVSAQVASRAPMPMITIAMGAYGTITRLAGPFYGAALSFASVGPTSAPGQLPLRLLRDYWHAAGLRPTTNA